MPLVVTNTLTRQREPFAPIAPPKVKMYVCGLTVYDFVHIGHARTYVAYDVIRRYLQHRGFEVFHVQNVTDVDDKIIARAHETGESPIDLARRFTEEADRDLSKLHLLRAHVYPKVSDHVPEILAMTQDLIHRGHAYVGKDPEGSSVYFDVRSDPDYGKLSHLDLDEMLEGVRKDVAEGKRHPADFALWKAAKPGEISWPSPWGPGRPGWHIECSAMATKHLGSRFDFHGGGRDLIFPHHENEVAQTESATGESPAVKYWVHTGFLTVEGEKMSKSLGNFITLRAALAEWPPEVLRLWLAGTHYASPIDFSEAGLAQAAKNLERIGNMLANLRHAARSARAGPEGPREAAFSKLLDDRRAAFENAMDEDFNTPVALATLFELLTDLNKYASEDPHPAALARGEERFRQLAGILGLVPPDGGEPSESGPLLDLLLEARELARKRKAFDVSDRIRDRLAELGYVIEDTPTGPKWRKK